MGASEALDEEARERLPAVAAAWASTHRVRVGRWDVRYREAGEGPTVVLVHGLGMASDYWHRTAPIVAAAGFRVLAPDLPGFGRTAGPPDGLAVERQGEVLRLWSSAMGLPPAAYVGHSLSCQSVVELASRFPALVTALVLVAPTGQGGELRMALEASRLFRDAWREELLLLVQAAQAYFRAGPLRFWRTWRSGAAHDPLPALSRVAVPALVVIGDRDPVVPLSFAEEVTRALVRGRLAVVPGGTHALFFEEPERFNAVVTQFLREAL